MSSSNSFKGTKSPAINLASDRNGATVTVFTEDH